MTYTPTTWANGDTITAAKLNNAEQGIVDAQNGWSVESSSTVHFDGSVTTTGEGEYFATLTLTEELPTTVGATATITFNGTAYTCTCFDDDGAWTYGGAYGDFSTYPFSVSNFEGWGIATQSAGTYTLKIETVGTTTVETSDDFATASRTAVGGMAPFRIVLGTTTWQEAYDAMAAGRMAFVDMFGDRRMQPVIYVNTGNYSIICMTYASGLTTVTYDAASADSAITDR